METELAKLHRVYYFGKKAIVEKYFVDHQKMQPLSWLSIFRLRPTDIVITPRAWSILFEFFFIALGHRRPYLVQLADGLIFPENCKKKSNQRYGHLYKNIFADLLIVRQNKEDLEGLADDLVCVQSIAEVASYSEMVVLEQPSALLIAGNDAVFDHDQSKVVGAFSSCALNIEKLGIEEIALSCPDQKLAADICSAVPYLKSVGKLSEYEFAPDKTLCIGSPSTVLFDNQLNGGMSFFLSIYSSAILDRYMVGEYALEAADVDGKSIRIQVKRTTIQGADEQINSSDLLRRLGSKRVSKTSTSEWFLNLRVSLLAKEIMLLARQH